MEKYKGLIPEIEIKLKRTGVHRMKIETAKDAADAFRYFFDSEVIELYEQFMVIYLDCSMKTIGWFKVSKGGIDSTVVDGRIIFATALKVCASAMILAHNHPSGGLTPSDADRKETKRLKEVGDFHGIRILDHIILTESGYFSFANEGLL